MSSILISLTQVQLPDGKQLKLDWERTRVFDREVAQMFVNLIKSGDKAWWVVSADSLVHSLLTWWCLQTLSSTPSEHGGVCRLSRPLPLNMVVSADSLVYSL